MSPRIRSVHPDIYQDERLARVSASAERTFIRLWCHLDDDGRCEDRPRLLASTIYPEHDDMTATEVDADLDQLAANDLLLRYEIGGTAYLSAKPSSWARYQSPRHPKPSRFPGPDDPTATFRRTATAERRTTHAGGEGRGVGGEVEVGGVGAAKPPANRATRIPDDCPSNASVRWAHEKYPELDIEHEVDQFRNHHQSKGSTFKDWNAAWRTWMGNASKWQGQRRSAPIRQSVGDSNIALLRGELA